MKLEEHVVKGYIFGKLIDINYSPLRRTKKKIIAEPNLELSYHVMLPYPIVQKKPKKKKEYGQFKKFMEMFN